MGNTRFLSSRSPLSLLSLLLSFLLLLLLLLLLPLTACATLREGPIAKDHDDDGSTSDSAAASPPPPSTTAAAGASSSGNAVDPSRGDSPRALGTIANASFVLREATAFLKSEDTGPNGFTATLILHLHDHVGFCPIYIASETARGSMSITLSISISRDTSPEIAPGRYNIGEPTNLLAKTITTVRAHAMRANASTCANDFPSSSRNAKPGGLIDIVRIDSATKRVTARFDLEFADGDRIHGEVSDVPTCPSHTQEEGRIPQGCGTDLR